MRTGPLRLGRGLRALLQGVPGLLGQHRASREEERAHRAHRHLRKFLSIVLLLIFTTNEISFYLLYYYLYSLLTKP